MSATLFLTGASGFLGTHLLAQLEPADYDSVTLLCRHGLRLPARLAAAGNVHVVQASLHEVDKYAGCLGPDTCVVHLAAITGKADRPQYFAVNTHATGLLIKAAEAAQVRGFLFVSSIAVSFRDRRGYHYAESKEQAEMLLQSSRLRYCIMRPTIILGPDAAIWKSFLGLARRRLIVLPGNGQARIQPVYVDDMVRLIMEFVGTDRFRNEVLEIGGPEVMSLDGFVRRIHRACTGNNPVVLHLPLVFILGPLRLLESFMAARLPVSAGQFASFHNDGIVTANALVVPSSGDMLDTDAMIAHLLGERHGD
jgi:nucleoside-diphosphate-sugar epimerase